MRSQFEKRSSSNLGQNNNSEKVWEEKIYGEEETGKNCPLTRSLGTIFENMELIPFKNEHQVICVDPLEAIEPSFSKIE